MSSLTISICDFLFLLFRVAYLTLGRCIQSIILVIFFIMDPLAFSSSSLIAYPWVQVDQTLSVTGSLNPSVLTGISFTFSKKHCSWILRPCTCWANTFLLSYSPRPLTLPITGTNFETISKILSTLLHQVHPSRPGQETLCTSLLGCGQAGVHTDLPTCKHKGSQRSVTQAAPNE